MLHSLGGKVFAERRLVTAVGVVKVVSGLICYRSDTREGRLCTGKIPTAALEEAGAFG